MNEEEKNSDCPCDWEGCPRHRNCLECQAYHHAVGDKTACGK